LGKTDKRGEIFRENEKERQTYSGANYYKIKEFIAK
jgi:hypothetical protein